MRILVWMAMPMIVAPVAGALADRYGNKPFMMAGLFLQGAGLAWLAAVVKPGVGYPPLIGPLLVSGIGVSMCFPTVANPVSVPCRWRIPGLRPARTARYALGGVFGIAIVAAVFAANGSYASRYLHRRLPAGRGHGGGAGRGGRDRRGAVPGKERTG